MMKKPAKPTKKMAAKKAMKPKKTMKRMMKGAMYALPFALLCLGSGCASFLNRTPILSTDVNGETVVAYATTIKCGVGTKEAVALGNLTLSADNGLSVNGLDSKTDSATAWKEGFAFGTQAAAAYLKTQFPGAGAIAPVVSAVATPVEQNSEPVVVP